MQAASEKFIGVMKKDEKGEGEREDRRFALKSLRTVYIN